MPRTVERVEDLVDEDPEFVDALETILDRVEDGELQWGDVNDDIDSGRWGRLIEAGVLVGGDEGMRLADPDGVRTALYGDDEPEEDGGSEPPGDGSWSKWDKIAGLAVLSLFPGYYFSSIRNAVGGTVDVLFAPVDTVLPFYAVIMVLAAFTGLYSTVLQGALINTERIAYYQNRMESVQDAYQEAKERGDDEELEEIQEERVEAMTENLGLFKEQFRPTVWMMILLIPVFLWMYWKILPGGGSLSGTGTVTMPFVGTVEWVDGVVGPLQAWILWYFLCSMSFGQVVRKALDIQMQPD
jgi:uncharacterized membrane protein (DUF106 family)